MTGGGVGGLIKHGEVREWGLDTQGHEGGPGKIEVSNAETQGRE